MNNRVFSALAGLFACSACAAQPQTNLSTVDSLDLNRYMGRWYEIAAYPQWFERDMTHVRATYTLEKEFVRVENSGVRRGRTKTAVGKAKVVEAPSKLKVSFFGPFYAPYWVVGLADDYSWAVVSDPRQKTLWILSRTPRMDSALYETITERLAAQGFDLNKLKKTVQD